MAKNKKGLVTGTEKPVYNPPVKETLPINNAISIPQSIPAPAPSVVAKSDYDTSSFKKYVAPGQMEKPKDTGNGIFINPETGRPSGITTPDGRTFLGLSPEDVNAVANDFNNRAKLPAGTQTIAQQNQTRDQQMLATQVGNVLPINGPQEAQPIDVQQVLGAGTTALVPGIIGGLTAGAAAGAGIGAAGGPIGAGAGALIGAIGGAAVAFFSAAKSNVKKQIEENVAVDTYTLTKGITNLKAIATDTNKNPQNAAENLALFNTQLALLDRAHGQLKLDTQRNVNKFIGIDGDIELAKYEMFNAAGGQREFLTVKMQTALIKPNPNEDLISVDEYLAGYE